MWRECAIHDLPREFLKRQRAALDAFSASAFAQAAKGVLYFCVACAFACKKSILAQKSAFDAVHRTIHCHKCKSHQTPVNLLGRILTIKKRSYFLCPQCLWPCVWGAECPHCALPTPPPAPTQCVICDNKHVSFTRKIVNVERLRVDTVHLCARHATHAVQSARTVYDMHMLARDAAVVRGVTR